MTDAPRDPAPDDPTRLREEVVEELEELVDDATAEERARMAERDAGGVDDPSTPPG